MNYANKTQKFSALTVATPSNYDSEVPRLVQGRQLNANAISWETSYVAEHCDDIRYKEGGLPTRFTNALEGRQRIRQWDNSTKCKITATTSKDSNSTHKQNYIGGQ